MSAARTEAACLAARPETLTTTFQAWRVRDTSIATPLGMEPCASLKEAVSAAAASCGHKDHLIVLEVKPISGKAMAHFHAIKRESKSLWRRDPVTGEAANIARLYPVLLFSMEVTSFSPAKPFHWSPGCDVVGIDRTLVEAAQ